MKIITDYKKRGAHVRGATGRVAGDELTICDHADDMGIHPRRDGTVGSAYCGVQSIGDVFDLCCFEITDKLIQLVKSVLIPIYQPHY
jgi:hypothetical protein